ncbi:MAG: hypothetical protein N4A31_06155 [Rickettsiales bacterium]|jgi:hypothetical protein|nr:hypothetical protein [Rickettsiales bacterium]
MVKRSLIKRMQKEYGEFKIDINTGKVTTKKDGVSKMWNSQNEYNTNINTQGREEVKIKDYNHYEFYKINDMKFSCPTITEKTDGLSDLKKLSPVENICDKLKYLQASISYNSGRMSKLGDEYKCSKTYYKSMSVSDPKPTPNCNDKIYSDFADKFYKADQLTHYLKYNFYVNKEFLLSDLLQQAKITETAFRSLMEFTLQNKDKVNEAFELADYDTNIAGGMAIFTSIFAAPFGMAAHTLNVAVSNNEFDGKINRAMSDVQSIINYAQEISSLMGELPDQSTIHN